MGLLDMVDDGRPATNSRRLGVVRAEVTENTDLTMQGRVRVKIPTIPGIEPWAHVCAPFAGDGYGLWCMPQVGDIVVVAFENGDLNWPVVIGSVWDSTNRPPIDIPTEATTKRVLRTPTGHELVIDDLKAAITLTHVAGHTLTMSAKEVTIELQGGAASITLSLPGRAEVSAAASADVKAAKATVTGDTTLDLSGASTSLTGDATCKVTGGLVTIN